MCILILLVVIFKNKSHQNISNLEPQGEGLFRKVFKHDISKIILPEEITWLKYYNELKDEANKESEKPLEKSLDPIFSMFKLNENSLIKEKTIIESQNEMIVYDDTLKKTLDKNNPEVLIYSTHKTESYSDVSIDGMENDEKDYNVTGLGEMLAKNLEEGYGIATKYSEVDKCETYIESYALSRENLLNELESYSGYKLIIDLHRDSVGENKDLVTTSVNGETVAKFMFVEDLSTETIYENQEIMNELVSIANILYPGICRGIYSWESGSGHFNLDVSGNVILIELGATCNTFEEAKGTVKYLSTILAYYLNRE